jgi:hypothetical protein
MNDQEQKSVKLEESCIFNLFKWGVQNFIQFKVNYTSIGCIFCARSAFTNIAALPRGVSDPRRQERLRRHRLAWFNHRHATGIFRRRL